MTGKAQLMVKPANSLALMSRAAQMLAEANTIQEVKEFRDLALTAAECARRKGLGKKVYQGAWGYALEAERKLGGMLVAMEPKMAKGGRPKKTGIGPIPVSEAITLKEIGITKIESSQAKFLVLLSEETFRAVKHFQMTRTEARRQARRAKVLDKAPSLPTGKYRVLYADPPWLYGNKLTAGYGGAAGNYPVMSISELCALDVESVAEENAVLFLWVTSPLLEEVFPVIQAWGFKYKASMVWHKDAHNFGHYFSVRHEYLLLCTRGSCLPDSDKLLSSVVTVKRSKKHSQKPEEFRRIIEKMYTSGPKIELFAREKHAGWKTWGNQPA